MIRWSVGTEFIFHLGVMGHAAYLSDPSKQIMEAWVFVGLVMVPFCILLFFRHGEFSDEAVARAHLLAAVWYITLTVIVAAMAAEGYRPHGWILFLVFIGPGAIISLSLILQMLRDRPYPNNPP